MLHQLRGSIFWSGCLFFANSHTCSNSSLCWDAHSMTRPNARGGYLSQWQFCLSHSGHENEEDCDHRRTSQLLFHKIGRFQARQHLFFNLARIWVVRKIRNINYEKSVVRIKNPTSQDESGVLFQINHFDPPLGINGAERNLFFLVYRGSLGM